MVDHEGKHWGKRKGRSQPIQRHPLFPAIVALWFGALLGAGSLLISASTLERIVLALHIDSIVPAAAPPLGVTARAALAVILGILGSAAGWVLAWRLGAEPAPAAQVFKVADLDDTLPWPGTSAHAAPEAAPLSFAEEIAEDIPQAFEDSVFEPEPEPIEAPIPDAPAPTAADRIAAADLGKLSHVELVERLAIALGRRQQVLDAAPAEASDARDAVVRFPGLADRQNYRTALSPAALAPAPQETEKALRDALATLQRMSGGA